MGEGLQTALDRYLFYYATRPEEDPKKLYEMACKNETCGDLVRNFLPEEKFVDSVSNLRKQRKVIETRKYVTRSYNTYSAMLKAEREKEAESLRDVIRTERRTIENMSEEQLADILSNLPPNLKEAGGLNG